MAPALIPRSFSSPANLPQPHPGSTSKSPSQLSPRHRRQQDEAWRSKCLPKTPDFDVPTFDADFQLNTSFLSDLDEGWHEVSDCKDGVSSELFFDCVEQQEDLPKPALPRSKTTHFAERPKTWFGTSRWAEGPKLWRGTQDVMESGQGERRQSYPELARSDNAGQIRRSKDVAASVKRSWMPSVRTNSRPASPVEVGSDPAECGRVEAMASRRSSEQTRLKDERSKFGAKSFGKHGLSLTTRFRTKPDLPGCQADPGPDSDQSRTSSSLSLVQAGSASTDTYTSRSTRGSTAGTADDSSSDMDAPHRDPLSAPINALADELQYFKARQTSQRVQVVNALLLPFLNSTAHASTISLCLEDVERRASVLNGWWNILLSMLEGAEAPQKHPLPHVDRPGVLEAITMIMMRAEWRQTVTYYQHLKDRSPLEKVTARAVTKSPKMGPSSTQPTSGAQSVSKRVMDMFRANLIRQMRFVVEKMTLHHVPITMVSFSGKTCAYAFFFAPGIADILLRSWGVSHEALRRTARAFSLPLRNTKESEDIVALFPPHLSPFGWSFPHALWHSLTHSTKWYPGISEIPWSGPWVTRWKGLDTDLFYIFCKHFHLLAHQFMPSGLPLIEKARSPGFAIVQAQLLSLVDSTIHSNAVLGGLPSTDQPRGPEASLMAAPIRTPSVGKGTSEHRFIALLKDFQSDPSEESGEARRTFVEVSSALLQAAALRTLQYNHGACFSLCDLLEGVVKALHDYSPTGKTAVHADWDFWLDVCTKMLETHHTMTEIRVLSFVYSAWDAVIQNPQRKLRWCEWLTSASVFDKFFNHWCPMVRAYYQRLLCWRICRDEGTGSSVDEKIFRTVENRLQTVWAHYLYMKQDAERTGGPLPSSAPMLPTPGKKLIIVRQEADVPQQSFFVGFDSFPRPANRETFENLGVGMADAIPKEGSKKRWTLLGKALSLAGSRSNSTTEPLPSSSGPGTPIRRPAPEPDGVPSSSRGQVRPSPVGSPRLSPALSSATTQDGAFVFTFYLGWHQQNGPAQNRILTRPRLPAPAHDRTTARVQNETPPTTSANLTEPARLTASGSPSGLVGEAKNSLFSPPGIIERETTSQTRSTKCATPDSRSSNASDVTLGPAALQSAQDHLAKIFSALECQTDAMAEAKKPSGFYTRNVVYSGRALAEWGTVVFECNSFLERRREEGVAELSEMEVPHLSVEGFRRLGG